MPFSLSLKLLTTPCNMSRLMTKSTKWYVRPAKTQISLVIRLVRSESSLSAAWILSYPLSAPRRLWLDWADVQADLSLRWAHMEFCWFCGSLIISKAFRFALKNSCHQNGYFLPSLLLSFIGTGKTSLCIALTWLLKLPRYWNTPGLISKNFIKTSVSEFLQPWSQCMAI